MSVRSQLDIKEKMLKSEESLRKQLEVQMNRLTNSRICDRIVRGSLDNLSKNSLETPIMSPEHYRGVHYSQNISYYKKWFKSILLTPRRYLFTVFNSWFYIVYHIHSLKKNKIGSRNIRWKVSFIFTSPLHILDLQKHTSLSFAMSDVLSLENL